MLARLSVDLDFHFRDCLASILGAHAYIQNKSPLKQSTM